MLSTDGITSTVRSSARLGSKFSKFHTHAVPSLRNRFTGLSTLTSVGSTPAAGLSSIRPLPMVPAQHAAVDKR